MREAVRFSVIPSAGREPYRCDTVSVDHHDLAELQGTGEPRLLRNDRGLSLRSRFQKEACSTAAATRNTVLSSKCLPSTCNPMGRPDCVLPQGTLIPGTPARSAV